MGDISQDLKGHYQVQREASMTDRELLEKAAKAAGLAVIIPAAHQCGLWIEGLEDEWNPLTDDGDALRLAVDLRMSILLRPLRVEVLSWPTKNAPIFYGFGGCVLPKVETIEPYEDNPHAATRRAIVRAAAQIGEHMTELTEANLEAMLMEIRKHLDDTGDRVSLTPTHFIFRPSDLEKLGLTVDEVTKMIKEKNT